jgi:hypothetical protein
VDVGLFSNNLVSFSRNVVLEVTEKARRINPRRFDDLVEEIANQPV